MVNEIKASEPSFLSGVLPAKVNTLFKSYNKDTFFSERHLDTKEIARTRRFFSFLLPLYLRQLEEINSELFPYLLEAKKAHIRKFVLETFYLLYAKYQLDAIEGRTYTLKDLGENMELCADLIGALDQNKTIASMHQERIDESKKPGKYLGRFIAEELLALFDKLVALNKTGTITAVMTAINSERLLYWVWGSSLFSYILAIWPDDAFNKQQAQMGLNTVAPFFGYMSWVLYYARFSINLMLLVKHTLGPWVMQNDENDIPMMERFKTQWELRKFALINDAVWATANLACFYWLVGSGLFGYAGNLVTVGLLFMDLVLSTWQFWEESTRHNKNSWSLQERRLKLLLDRGSNPENRAQIDEELFTLEKMIAKSEGDWAYRRAELLSGWFYALGLILSFTVMCCLFLPPFTATAAVVGLGGAALCFLLSVADGIIKGGIAIAKTKHEQRLVKLQYDELVKKFKQVPDGVNSENIKKQLYLDIERLRNTGQHQERIMNFQAIQLLRTVLINALVPGIIFCSLMFMPLGIGLAVMAAGLAIALISHILIKRLEPKAKDLPVFNQAKYEAFASKVKHAEPKGGLGLFHPREKPAKDKVSFTPPWKST
ncbi:MAG: hypothetical protein WC785_00830 [Tatlockia sp.]|jgi:hypothetical protein